MAGYACENCGRPGHTEVHHILPLALAAKHYPWIAPAILSSLENAMCLCPNCHRDFDKKARKNHSTIARELEKRAGKQEIMNLR